MAFRVLDASAFYAGVPFGSQNTHHTTSLVFDEISHIKKDHDALGVLLESKKLVLQDPQEQFTKKATDTAKKTGDLQQLSKADISAIALSAELNAELVTDDYAVSNVAKTLNLKVTPVMTKGISKVGNWIYYCPACKKNFSSMTACPICGNKLKRLLRERTSIPRNK